MSDRTDRIARLIKAIERRKQTHDSSLSVSDISTARLDDLTDQLAKFQAMTDDQYNNPIARAAAFIKNMTKQDAITLIDAHKNTLLNPVEMLDWTWLRVILMHLHDVAWDTAVENASDAHT